jgi:putative transposase
MTKLTDKKIRLICRHVAVEKDWSKNKMAEHFGITVRRIEQITKQYKDTGQYPRLNNSRRPKGPTLTESEIEHINSLWLEKRCGARKLFQELKKKGYEIPHHKLHEYLVKTGRTIPNPNKQKKRKRCRYERDHSFSLVHGDWHRTSEDHPYVILWLDDASRYILAGGEFPNENANNSIATFDDAMLVAEEFNGIIREVNTDKGPQFYANKGISQFEAHLDPLEVILITSRRNNPQTNGKLERLWFEYDKHRWRFQTLRGFIAYHNDCIHDALWTEIYETPNEAVWRKLLPESILGLFWRLNQ